MDLGPTGFPFEKFVAALWQAEGFATQTGQIVKGFCVSHEVDVIAEKENLHYLTECKFHSFQGKPCDVKHALYVFARFLDIEKKLKAASAHADKTHKMWLVTNTRLTTDAETYGTCAGLGLISWDFPRGDGLRERVDRAGLHPVTCLTSLSLKEKRRLLDKEIVLCRDLCDKPQVLTEIGIRENKIAKILEEADEICYGI
ncbi:MAG TPA: ATPase [Blastocatellia bacterium]|nr:ATPase [Blastocatellia bacterium]